ncbi:MAG: Nitronate monooxygenase [Candidatus Dichloromethanomonas elyunquensis]|nr:MAG: Nitronate monooxygenase [Candidatus Dichloromethanomonas elyunquensis]
MRTRLTDLLGIKYPIIQGAMALVSEAKLVAAVGNAGGAGVIASGGRNDEWVRSQIRLARQLTNKPFGVNIVFKDKDVEDKIKVICEEEIAFITTGAGNPVRYIDTFHRAGIKVIPVVSSLKLAKRVEAGGADAIVIEGMESGGYIGKLTTLALMTQVITEVSVPVIAAGGFSDGRGLAAALVMGAAGIQMGTRFYASTECVSHLNAKQAIVNADDTDTEIIGSLHGPAVRIVKNKLSDKFLEEEKAGASAQKLADLVADAPRKASEEGDTEWGAVYAGQSLSMIKSIGSCTGILEQVVEEAKQAIRDAQVYSSTIRVYR